MKIHAEILLVEDNEGDIELTQIAFEKCGMPCNIHVAHNGTQALDFLSRRGNFKAAAAPDIILLDINMPGMDGIEFLRILKQSDPWKTIPVIMLTSSMAPMDILNCYQLHANCYIIKPPSAQKFADAAKQIINFWINFVKLAPLMQLA